MTFYYPIFGTINNGKMRCSLYFLMYVYLFNLKVADVMITFTSLGNVHASQEDFKRLYI